MHRIEMADDHLRIVGHILDDMCQVEVACAAPANGDNQKVAVKRFYLY